MEWIITIIYSDGNVEERFSTYEEYIDRVNQIILLKNTNQNNVQSYLVSSGSI